MSIRRPSIHIPLFPCGVGSLPQTDPDAAVASVLQTYWRMPFWPQLPNRGPAEQLIPQAGLDLPGATWDGQLLHWSGTPSDAALADVGLPPPERAAGLHAFIAALEAMPADQRPPLIKGQIVGPLTLSMLTRDANGAAPHDDPQTLLWLARLIGRAGAAQVRRLQELVPHVVLVFDEPALASVEEPLLPLTWRADCGGAARDTGARAGAGRDRRAALLRPAGLDAGPQGTTQSDPLRRARGAAG